jgi:small subunit ribosomal protein S1
MKYNFDYMSEENKKASEETQNQEVKAEATETKAEVTETPNTEETKTEEAPKAEEVVAEAPAKEEVIAEETPVEEKAEEAAPKKAAKPRVRKSEKVDVEAAAETSEEVTEEVAEAPVVEVAEVQTPRVKNHREGQPAETFTTAEINPLEDFDWSTFGKKQDVYKADEKENLENVYNETLTSIADHEVIDGTVVAKNKKEVVVNIGYKSEGVIPTSEFRYNPDLAIGEKVEVYVESTEDRNGILQLSHKKARSLRAWDRVNDAMETSEIIKGFVKCRTKGGLIVDVFGIEAFLPGSQIDVKPIRDYDQYVGNNMEFKVVKINKEFRNVVVSHKALIEAELEEQKVEIMQKLEKGQVLEGVVKNITSYGVFIDLGGVDGLIHITDLSWGRVNHPEEIVELDKKVNVVILDFDDQKKRIALGMKQLQEHPWDSLDKELKIGDTVKGKVVVLADYGAFVEIAPGVEGLIHVSEMSWSQHLRTASDFFSVGDEVESVIMTLDREERKMSLSPRKLSDDPWENIEAKYPIESKHKGKVTNISNFGVFIELEEGIDGLVHISDLSWSKKINHPAEFIKVGEDLEAVVLEIDKDNRRLSLGHKQLEENPWEVFESVFTEGSVHQGTVLSMADKGAVVGLPYGIEGFAPGRHLVKEDGSKVKVDETIDFKVLEFNRDGKKIIVSHSRIHEDEQRAEGVKEEKKAKTRAKATNKIVKNINSNMEKTTLGDLDALSELKQDMEKKESEAKKK